MKGKLIIGLMIFCLVGVLFIQPSFAWLSGWDYRQPINISNTAGDLTNYQVKIDLNSSNVGSNFNWSNNGSDIRFTNSTDDELNFWIESWNSTGQEATIWVNVSYLANNTNTTIYMYYGNSEASSASDGEATFGFFDGGNECSSWISSTSNHGTINCATYYDKQAIKFTDTSSNGNLFYYRSDLPSSNNFYFGWSSYLETTGGASDVIYELSNANSTDTRATIVEPHRIDQDNFDVTYNGSPVKHRIGVLNQWRHYLLKIDDSEDTYHVYIDNIENSSTSPTTFYQSPLGNLIRLNIVGGYDFSGSFYLTSFFFATYTSPEPTVSSFGSEEESGPFSITLNSPPNQITLYDPTPDFNFIVSGNESSYSCELFINDTGYGTATANNNTATIITANQSLSDGTYSWYINCTAGGYTKQSEVREFTRWVGLNISVYYDNGTEATNWNISITNRTDTFSGTYNDSIMLRWNEIPYGEINITIDDGSDTLYYYQNTTNTTNNETNYQEFNFTLTAKGNNTLILTATPSWSITESQQVQITCTAEEGTPRLYMDDTEISNPYTGQPTTGTYTITCNVSSETTNYRPTTKNRTLIVTPPMASCTNNETFAFSTEVTTTTNITTLNFTKFVNQHYVKEDLSDVYVPNVSNVWKNTVNGYYIVVNNTNLSSFTVYFGNYYAYRNYTNHAVSNVKNITLYQQENTYAMFRLLDEVTGEELYPPNTTEVVMYVSCAQGSNYVNIEENDTQFLIAFNSYPTKLLTRVQYSVDTYYSRSLYPSQQKDQYLLSFYLIDAYKYYTDKINFVILSSDYYDAKLQVYKKVSNQTIIITEGYFDKMRTFPAYLLEDHDYYLRLINGDEIRDIGTFTVTSAGTQYLDVSQVVLSPSVSLFADKVTIGAEYNNTTDTIRIQYRDLTDKTINITISVYNNTGLYFQQTYNSSNFTITLNDVPKNQSWYVRYVLYHEIYGNSPITGSVSLIQGILLPIGVASWLYPFISFFILFLTSSIITPRNLVGGMLAIFVLLYLLYYIGWLSLTADAIVVISIILVMGLLLHLRSRGEAL